METVLERDMRSLQRALTLCLAVVTAASAWCSALETGFEEQFAGHASLRPASSPPDEAAVVSRPQPCLQAARAPLPPTTLLDVPAALRKPFARACRRPAPCSFRHAARAEDGLLCLEHVLIV